MVNHDRMRVTSKVNHSSDPGGRRSYVGDRFLTTAHTYNYAHYL